jgi:hypothetical protein
MHNENKEKDDMIIDFRIATARAGLRGGIVLY